MTVRIVRDATLKGLRDSVAANLDRYRTGDFSFLDADPSQWHELPIAADDDQLDALQPPSQGELFEVQNCKAVFGYLANLRPYDARDERLWVHLTHTKLLAYARQRWPIPADEEKAVAHIRRHFFAQNNRQVERDNAASRLWWMAHLCHRVPNVDQNDALQALLLRSDVRANIVERPTVAQSVNVFSVILRRLILSHAGGQALFDRMKFRRLMMEVNSVGGFKLLDCLPQSELDAIFDDIIQNRLELAAI